MTLLTLPTNRLKNLSVGPIDKESSIIKITGKGEVIQKEIDFLDKLAQNYLGLGLNERTKWLLTPSHLLTHSWMKFLTL